MFKFLIIMITIIKRKINIISICAYFTIQSCFLTLLLWLYNSSPTSELPQFLKFPFSFSLPLLPYIPSFLMTMFPFYVSPKFGPNFDIWMQMCGICFIYTASSGHVIFFQSEPSLSRKHKRFYYVWVAFHQL